MSWQSRGVAVTTVCVLATFSGVTARAQDKPAEASTIPLTVQAGVPLHLALDKAVPIKRAGIPVEAHVLEPVYVFDHLVIPAGTKVQGHVSEVQSASRKRRALAIANGNFTPLRTARLDFDTLTLPEGKPLSLKTLVSQGTPPVVHLVAGEKGKKKGRVSQKVDQAREQAKQREHRAIEAVKAPGKMQRLKALLIAQLPYHRQSFPVGTHFTAELQAPLDFGSEDPPAAELEHLGGEIPPGSVVRILLATRLSSATDHRGAAVEAVVSEPVFSSDHHLILPQGARLEGAVSQAVPARRLGRNGQLRFTFHQIEMPQQATPRHVEASLQAVDVPGGGRVELDAEGGAHAVTSKTKFIAPAIDVLLATSSLDGMEHHHHLGTNATYDRGPDVGGGAVRGGAGFGLVGTVIGIAAHYRPVSAGFAFYGAGRSVYSHVVARGADVVFPKNTPMDIRFGTHEGSTPPGVKQKLFSENQLRNDGSGAE